MLTRLYIKATNSPKTKLGMIVGGVVVASMVMGLTLSTHPIGIARP